MIKMLSLSCLALGVLLALAYKAIGWVSLTGLGPASYAYLGYLRHSLAVTAIVALISSVILGILRNSDIWQRISTWYSSAVPHKKAWIVLALCFSFLFILNFHSIWNGYFNYDDFEVVSVDQAHPLAELVFMPNGDHALPLFRIEVRALLNIFGARALPFNMFVFLISGLVPFFSYFLLKRLGFSDREFFLFLILYSGTMLWGEILTGYYILSVYIQSSLFCVLALLSYLKWRESRRSLNLVALGLFGLLAVTVDIAGAWALPVIGMFIVCRSWIENGSVCATIKKDLAPILSVIIAGMLFAAYIFYAYHILRTGTFVETSHAGAKILKDFFLTWNVGLTSSLVAPYFPLLLLQPAFFAKIATVWNAFIGLLFFAQIGLFSLAFKRADRERRIMLSCFLAATALCVLLVALARPTTGPIDIFPFKLTAMAYFWYCISLVSAYAAISRRNNNGFMPRVGIWLLILVFIACQSVFSFFNQKTVTDAVERRAAVEHLGALAGAIERIPGENLSIPDLSGMYIYEPLSGYDLTKYLPFIALPQRVRIIDSGERPSAAFITALKSDTDLRSFYLKPVTIYPTAPSNGTRDFGPLLAVKGTYRIHIKKSADRIALKVVTSAPRFSIDLRAQNDFNATGTLAAIMIDQFIPYTVENGKKVYTISIRPADIYAISLSNGAADVQLAFDGKSDYAVSSYSY